MGTATVDHTRVNELKTALTDVLAENDRILGAVKTEAKSDEGDGGVGYVVTKDQQDAIQANLGKAKDLRSLIEAEEANDEYKQFMREPAGSSVAVFSDSQLHELSDIIMSGGGRNDTPHPFAGKSLGEVFFESSEWKDFRSAGGYTMQRDFQVQGIDIGSMLATGRKDVYSTLLAPTTTIGFGTLERDGFVPPPMRTVRVRDLFPARPTAANLIDFYMVTGYANNASVVPERTGSGGSAQFALKPHSTLTFTPGRAPVVTIAHYEVAHRNALDDEPQLRGTIDTELLYGLRLQEDYQILQGQGGDDMEGILNNSRIQHYAQTSGLATDNQADAIRRSITLANLAYYEPTGCVLNPLNWEDIELTKDANDRYLVAASVAIGASKTLWRLPVVDTPAMPENTALVGSFGLGAQLYDRQQANVRIAEQHADFFLRNAIVILAEERLAMAVKRPESFVKVTLS